MNVLAIDQGTSATKALVIAPGGEVLGEGQAPVRPRATAAGEVVQDPHELLASVVEAGRLARRDARATLGAVGVGNQGETVLAWDPDTGAPLGDAISWQDRRSSAIADELAAHAERLAELTGLMLDPYFAAPKMSWLARQPDRGGVITTIDCWITHQLCGAFVTDAATASRTMLLDLDSGEWSDEACELFGLRHERRPGVVANAAVVGETTAFGGRLPVTALVVDQQAALFAQSCFARGEAKCTYGTGAFILANAGARAPRSRSRLAACIAWRLDDTLTYCLDGQVYTAGAAVSWLRDIGLIADATELDRRAPADPPGDGSPIFVPALAGMGAPYWAPAARGAWLGLSLATRADDLVGAVVWGIAAQVASLATAVERDLGRPLARLRVDGGLSRSARLMQAQADLLQIPVERYPSPDATALGIGALARIGAGETSSGADAVGTWEPSAVFEPSIGADHAAELLGRFQAAAEALIAI
ncbi:MAG: FGGY family carbohydrate kinase [Solirubrobacteraceae bacterium]